MDFREPRRRAFLAEPGEALLLADSALGLANRFGEWTRTTGLSPEMTYSDPLLAVPLPIRSTTEITGRDWPITANAAMFWHPLFWLPDRVALRYQIQDEAGNITIETDNEWAVRVALELTLIGLYDNDTGTWLDILDRYDLDIDDPEVQERVHQWLLGADDEVLDSIDLGPALEQENPEWALEAATEMLTTLTPSSWALIANDLIAFAENIRDEANTVDEVKEGIATVTALAIASIPSVPGAGTEPDPKALWARIEEVTPGYGGTVEQLKSGPLRAFTDSVYSIRDDYWPFLTVLAEETQTEGPPAVTA